MQVKWTGTGLSDLARLHDFLAPVNALAAARVVQSLTAAASNLADNPRIGRKLGQFEPREVRRIFAGAYEMRYEIAGAVIYVLRIWHARESR
jgi:plasmid stabilization system protein ParE